MVQQSSVVETKSRKEFGRERTAQGNQFRELEMYYLDFVLTLDRDMLVRTESQ